MCDWRPALHRCARVPGTPDAAGAENPAGPQGDQTDRGKGFQPDTTGHSDTGYCQKIFHHLRDGQKKGHSAYIGGDTLRPGYFLLLSVIIIDFLWPHRGGPYCYFISSFAESYYLFYITGACQSIVQRCRRGPASCIQRKTGADSGRGGPLLQGSASASRRRLRLYWTSADNTHQPVDDLR